MCIAKWSLKKGDVRTDLIYSGSQLAAAGEPGMQLAVSQCCVERRQSEKQFIDLAEISQSHGPHASPFIPLST